MDINANTDAGVRVFQPLPDDLSKAEQIDYTIGALVADMRFALLEISKLREDNHAMQLLLNAGKAQQILELVSPATPSTVIMNTSSPLSSAISSCTSAHAVEQIRYPKEWHLRSTLVKTRRRHSLSVNWTSPRSRRKSVLGPRRRTCSRRFQNPRLITPRARRPRSG